MERNTPIKQGNPLIKKKNSDTEMQAIQDTVALRIVISYRMSEEPSYVASVGNVNSYPFPASTPFLMVTPQWSWQCGDREGLGDGMRVFPV